MSRNAGVPKLHRPTVKVILVGPSGVGKTSLIGAYFKQPFDIQTDPTVAPAYSCADVKRKDGLTVNLQIWDTAGQERFYSVSKLFFRDADVAFVCFEVGDQKSIDDISNWISRVKEEVALCKIILVGTKIDLQSSESLKKFNEQEIGKLKEKYQTNDVFLTSAITKDGVQDLFYSAADFYKTKTKPATQNIQAEETKKKGCC